MEPLNSTNRTTWLSGEVCTVAGQYFSDSCGHELKRELAANDIFPRCPTCHQAVRWISSGQARTRMNPPRENGLFGFLREQKKT